MRFFRASLVEGADQPQAIEKGCTGESDCADDVIARPELPHRAANEIPPPACVIERPPVDH